MAEDILRVIGFVDGVNYHKQATVAGTRERPDFVFPLPGGLNLNMDVKFPFDNYQRFIEAASDAERDTYRTAFLHDVRRRVKEITTREYIDPEGGTVDFVLLFIPNESIYAFMHEQDTALFDDSLKMKVVCCSPYMLFAMLALVDQAAKTLSLQKASEEILTLYGRFSAEWKKFTIALDTLGRRLDSARTAYDQVVGARKRQLERPLDHIEALRVQRGLSVATEEQASLLPEDDLIALASADDEDDEE